MDKGTKKIYDSHVQAACTSEMKRRLEKAGEVLDVRYSTVLRWAAQEWLDNHAPEVPAAGAEEASV
jgi:hypothetical protein